MFFKTESGSTYCVDPARNTVCGDGTGNIEVPIVRIERHPLVGQQFQAIVLKDGREWFLRTSRVTWARA